VPLVSESVKAGADLTLLSGAGFIGGPPCGIIVGRRELIDKIAAHPLFRAVRADKLTLAALGATLRLYEDVQLAERAIPVLSLVATSLENLRQRAERLAPQMAATGVASVEVVASQAYLGGHEVPGQAAATIVLSLTPKEGTAEQLAKALRLGTPAVVGRVTDGRLLLDLRSVMPRDDLPLITAITAQQRSPEAAPQTHT
jgi:L-seryl-tRNA(Ser) seleniumtransferase